MINIGNTWDEILKNEFEKEYYLNLRKFLISEYKSNTIYPDMESIFNALKFTSYEDVKVVILGQDPYHEPGQSHGLCFSVMEGVRKPPSLVNIFKELKSDLNIDPPKNGSLTKWAEQGVLLLNTCLTVRKGEANSHKGKGWEFFTDKVIELLNARKDPIVFILWGSNAKAKINLITGKQHLILTGAHPSPLSAYNGFYGGKYFSKSNDFLIKNCKEPINWQI